MTSARLFMEYEDNADEGDDADDADEGDGGADGQRHLVAAHERGSGNVRQHGAGGAICRTACAAAFPAPEQAITGLRRPAIEAPKPHLAQYPATPRRPPDLRSPDRPPGAPEAPTQTPTAKAAAQ